MRVGSKSMADMSDKWQKCGDFSQNDACSRKVHSLKAEVHLMNN